MIPLDVKVSIIVRAKNEEKWIGICLKNILSQSYKNFEIILVDSGSTDKTIEKARQFPLEVINITDFRPGYAINEGIRNSSGDIIVCLSSHCIPSNNDWLRNLIAPLKDNEICCVYGRQLPMNFTSAIDKRDLAVVFGEDSRLQIKDGYINNANSAFRRLDWEQYPFDELTTNIEDRIWGNLMISLGRKILYEPSAKVFHHHGINQGASLSRAESIVKIIEHYEGVDSHGFLTADEHENIFIVPFNESFSDLKSLLLEDLLNQIREYDKDIPIVLGLSEPKFNLIAEKYNVTLFDVSDLTINFYDVCAKLLDEFEKNNYITDAVLIVSPKNPFRPNKHFEKLFDDLYKSGLDCVYSVFQEGRDYVEIYDNDFAIKLNSEFGSSRLAKHNSLATISSGSGLAIRSNALRTTVPATENMGIVFLKDPLAGFEITDPPHNKDIYLSLKNIHKKMRNNYGK